MLVANIHSDLPVNECFHLFSSRHSAMKLRWLWLRTTPGKSLNFVFLLRRKSWKRRASSADFGRNRGEKSGARQAICTGSKTVHTLGEFVPPKTAKNTLKFVAQIDGASEITDRAGPLRIYCSKREGHQSRSAWELGSRPCGVDTSVQFL